MKSLFRFITVYLVSWVVFFDFLRLLFVLFNYPKTKELSPDTVLATFWYGLRMDLSMASYITAPVCLFVLLGFIIPVFWKRRLYKIYTQVILFLIALIAMTDLEMYSQWGFRIDASSLKFLATPEEAIASVSHLPILTLSVLFLVGYILCFIVFNYVINLNFFSPSHEKKLLQVGAVCLFLVALIIPIRGGLQLAPLNQSSVYFSKDVYANHAAVNATWNFFHSLMSNGAWRKNPYRYLPDQEKQTIVDSLYFADNKIQQVIRFGEAEKTNIILIIWESLTEKALHINIEGKSVLPHFNNWIKEGIFFSHVYASGDRTNKGIPAILSGYPAMPNTTVIHSPSKAEKLPVLSKLFKSKGYKVPFFYGGEPEFANIKSYLLHGGFDPIISKNDFDEKDMNSKWGAHDGVVMKRVIDELSNIQEPFFAGWLTLSSHEPFESPVPPVFPEKNNTYRFLNSLHYSDQVIHDFLVACSQQKWWDHTVVIIIGDHGHPLPVSRYKADDFKTPMLWLGGALNQKGIVHTRVVSQLDIPFTIATQAYPGNNIFPFSKNIMDSTAANWAYFSFNDGFGFVDETGSVVFDNIGKRPIASKGQVTDQHIKAGQAMIQHSYADFLQK